MASANNSLYHFLFTELADPRTNGWFMISSPVPLFIIMSTYFSYVTFWGPRYMKNRKPAEIDSILKVYNFFQVLFSCFLFYEVMDGLVLRKDFSFRCQPLGADLTKDSMREARCLYFYFLAKISELLDTVFFVLRKKDKQLTFLHIYHHTIVPIFTWGYVKYAPGGHIVIAAGINSFVHIVMYLYYMLAAYGPKFQKYLWWKRYITLMQLAQFLLVAIHNGQLLYTECNFPKASLPIILSNSFLFMYLFGSFYKRTYLKEGKDVFKNGGEDLKAHKA